MSKNNACIAFGCYAFTAFALCIAGASWMINVINADQWRKTIVNYMESETQTVQMLIKSWQAKPFVEIVMIDVEDNQFEQSCPESHPEELMYEIWSGTRALCDCLEQESSRYIAIDTMCVRGDEAPHNSEDCIDVGSLAPIV